MTILLLIPLTGCSKNPSYASYSNWDVNNEEFFNVYKIEYSSLIAEVASEKNIEGMQQIEDIGNDGFEIKYSINGFEIIFHFHNDATVAYFTAQLWHYEIYFNDLFDFGKYEPFLEFLDSVTSKLVFDYQGGKKTFEKIYDEKFLDNERGCYFYHFDDMTGDIGYSVLWDNQNSQDDPRSVILFKFRGLLKAFEFYE